MEILIGLFFVTLLAILITAIRLAIAWVLAHVAMWVTGLESAFGLDMINLFLIVALLSSLWIISTTKKTE